MTLNRETNLLSHRVAQVQLADWSFSYPKAIYLMRYGLTVCYKDFFHLEECHSSLFHLFPVLFCSVRLNTKMEILMEIHEIDFNF